MFALSYGSFCRFHLKLGSVCSKLFRLKNCVFDRMHKNKKLNCVGPILKLESPFENETELY